MRVKNSKEKLVAQFLLLVCGLSLVLLRLSLNYIFSKYLSTSCQVRIPALFAQNFIIVSDS